MKTQTVGHFHTEATRVHDVLRTKLLVDGYPFVYDPENSHDAFLVDARDGTEYLDLFSFFASQPLSYQHPQMIDPAFRERLGLLALTKPTCSDVYTQAQADFIAAFSRTLPPGFSHLFFIEGGALAVENALKAAFDWKVRKNHARGRTGELGTKVIHFKNAFHGRSGYTLSLTNTFDPRKYQYFPKFEWPRITTPGRRFPENEESLREVATLESRAIAEIKAAIAANPNDVACLIIETVQGEGGDVHFRPEFMKALRQICDESEIVLIFDEVQAGFGLTGRWWGFEHFGVQPDIFAFGKKTQICGIAATSRFDDVDSVFKIPSRINSTWGGNLIDMVRCQRFIEIIESERLLENARIVGAYALERLRVLEEQHKGLMSNARGAGLMCAFDLPGTEVRDRVRKHLLHNEKVIMLASGAQSLRFRPHLDFKKTYVDLAVQRIDRALRAAP